MNAHASARVLGGIYKWRGIGGEKIEGEKESIRSLFFVTTTTKKEGAPFFPSFSLLNLNIIISLLLPFPILFPKTKKPSLSLHQTVQAPRQGPLYPVRRPRGRGGLGRLRRPFRRHRRQGRLCQVEAGNRLRQQRQGRRGLLGADRGGQGRGPEDQALLLCRVCGSLRGQ